MMDAIISGHASALVLVEGDDAYIVHSTDLSSRQKIDFGFLKYVFEGVVDIVYLRRTSRDEAYKKFSAEVLAVDALRLTSILLDKFEPAELRRDAALELAQLIENGETRISVKNALFSGPLPLDADPQSAMQQSGPFAISLRLLEEIVALQPAIERVRSAWDLIGDGLFDNASARRAFFATAIKRGAIRELVESVALGPKAVNSAVLHILILLKDQPNHRSIITEWARDLRDKSRSSEDASMLVSWKETERADADNGMEGARPEGGHKEYQRVLAQQRAIATQLAAGNTTLARRFANDLVASQLNANAPDLAAKSLCRLAQEANSVGQYSLQLEWAKSASEISPDDSITYGHLADAYIFLNRFNEALDALDQVVRLGDLRFAETNRARVLRLQGRLDEALAAFDELKRAHGTDIGNGFAWNGYAEVLRDMWRFRDALAAYEESTAAYPNNVVAQSGKAAVLMQLGRLDEAQEAYDQALQIDQDSLFALAGKANVLRHKGQLEEALALFEHATSRFPANSIVFAGRAHVLRLMRKYDDAIQLLREGRRRFPYEVSLVSEMAEVSRDRGQLEESVEIYENARKEFPKAPHVLNGLAQSHKDMGALKVALQLYDENIGNFPYDMISRSGRADVLKRLGEFGAALDAYDEILRRWPERLSARHSKAAVLVVLGKFDEAEALLPTSAPESIEEWFASHVRGMILLKKERISEAIAYFEFSLEKVPFARERKYFQQALAIAYLRQEQFERAGQLMPEANEPVSNVLVFHAFAASGQTLRASQILRTVQRTGPADVIELSEEIARQFRLRDEPPKHNARWIFQKECHAVLLEAA